jgi:hypothetical protein
MNNPWPCAYEVDAHISPDSVYRYWLKIVWNDELPRIAFVLLNPSKADHRLDDPTAKRVVAFAQREGFGGVLIYNLFAFRATDPRELKTASDPEGPSNLPTLNAMPDMVSKIVVGWGAGVKEHPARKRFLDYMAHEKLWCLGTTKTGEPRHPLYLRGDAPLVRWNA